MGEIIVFIVLALLVTLIATVLHARSRLRVPSRRYEGLASVSNIYDNWTNDGILEFYWGEHLHAGYYGNPPIKKDFIAAKVDFIDELIRWGVVEPFPHLVERLEQSQSIIGNELVKILDVGCGIGGTVRHLARRWRDTVLVTGIAIAKAQAERATALTRAQRVKNACFLQSDALRMPFADETFDIIIAVESEMYMPDKDHFVSELVRTVKPGGVLLVAAFNVRDTSEGPLSKSEAADLQFLMDEWVNAKFISIREYVEIFEKNSLLAVASDNWAIAAQPSWRQAVWEAALNPSRILNISMKQRWALMRDAYTMFRYDEAFRTGLCEYGLIRGQKGRDTKLVPNR